MENAALSALIALAKSDLAPPGPIPSPPPAKHSEISMSSAYIRSLQRSLEAETVPQPLSEPDLKQRFIQWYDSVPEVSRYRPYSMVELEKVLDTQGKYLSAILLSLGWRRGRRWTGPGPYPRFWMPPAGIWDSFNT